MKLLFAGNYQLDSHKLNDLKKLNIDVYVMKEENIPLLVNPEEIDIIICNWLFENHDIRQFTNLKYVQLLSAGLDRMPLDYAKKNNIQVYNVGGAYSIPMAEFAVCGVLQLLKKSRDFMVQQSKHVWTKHRDLGELSDKTVCILGMGRVGGEVAKKFSVFCKKIIGVDIVEFEKQYFDKVYSIDMIDSAIIEADIIVITLPLTKNTKYLFDKEKLKKVKTTSIIVNIARGKIIKEKDLITSLVNNEIGGAVLDVFEEEPLNSDSLIWDNPKIIATPHNSFVSQLNDERIWKVIINNLKKYIQGEGNE